MKTFRILRGIIRIMMTLCYMALAGLVIYFPLAYAGEKMAFSFRRLALFANHHMTIEDGFAYLILIAILCSGFQMFDSYLTRIVDKSEGRR